MNGSSQGQQPEKCESLSEGLSSETRPSGSSSDLAKGLFAPANYGMPGFGQELQEDKMLEQHGKAGNGIADKNGVGEDFNTKRKNQWNSQAEGDVEKGPEAGLWVLGGATTVADAQGLVAAKGCNGNESDSAANQVLGALAPPVVAATMASSKECSTSRSLALSKAHFIRRVSKFWGGVQFTCKAMADITLLYPTTLIVPVMVFALLAGLGIWGVIAGANSHVQSRKDDARSRAMDAATGFQIQLQQSFTPGVTFTLLVKQRPDLEYWIQNFNDTAKELMSRVLNGSLQNMQLQPFAQVAMIWPMRSADMSQVAPPRNLLMDPLRRADIRNIITTKQPVLVGPVKLYDNSIGAFVRYPIFVPNVEINETFGYREFYPGANNTLPVSSDHLPTGVADCVNQGLCYNKTTREKWWGVASVLVNYSAVTVGQDAYLANLRKLQFNYELVRIVNTTHDEPIIQVGVATNSSLRDVDAVNVEFTMFARTWVLRVAPMGGFGPSWRDPLIAAVVIIAAIISVLLFVAIASFLRHLLLLKETVAANRNLAETTKRLEEEKERMDVLLVRQYDLLRCLDANRSGSKMDISDAVGASRKTMMARIEDARRSLNVAKASIEDTVQVFEVLGTGAFGKVQKGLWRGTVVAVKTMILPANMTGQQKREKMAVMEAAISSSLVHPNIVTTYTYFIRPYHEPTHEGVQQMLVTQSQATSGGKPTNSLTDTSVSEATIHSYEVRLVLEFCDKGSLKDALEQHAFMQGGAFNLAAMLETAADIAKAMVHMHAANVLHSDLKARNIMLKSSGTEGRGVTAKVADFGLSTRMEHQETHVSSCFQGTLTHMAPEVMLKGRISKAADVYSFGIVMWELFCGGEPYAGVPRAHIGHAITMEALRPRFPSFAPRDFVALAARCWDPDAAMRPSFEEVLAELMRMREELGGDTQPLIITPPKPLSPVHSGEGTAGGGQGGSATNGAAVNEAAAQLLRHNNHGVVVGNGSLISGGTATLYSAGIVLGGASSVDGSAVMSESTLGNSRSALAQRARLKSILAQRHLRKLGIRLGGPGSATLAQTLPALHEEAEQRETEQKGTEQRELELGCGSGAKGSEEEDENRSGGGQLDNI